MRSYLWGNAESLENLRVSPWGVCVGGYPSVGWSDEYWLLCAHPLVGINLGLVPLVVHGLVLGHLVLLHT